MHNLGVNINAENDHKFRYTNDYIEISKWLYNLDKQILINFSTNKHYLRILELDDNTINLIESINNNQPLPTIDYPIDDIVVYLLFHHNRINDLIGLDLPYVYYDVVNGKIVNGTIKCLTSKNARK